MIHLIAILISIFFLVIFLITGYIFERRHLKSLAQRELKVADLVVTTLKQPLPPVDANKLPMLVCGEAVIASDGFKTSIFKFRNLFGGESKTFSRLLMRARREAILRLLESAKAQGYNAICNIRYDTTDIAGNTILQAKNNTPMAIITVSGTAYKRLG